MHEIRIHGRGGQGAVTAAELIAKAAFIDGKFSQAFPYFGVERRGAPVQAFCRIDNSFIRIRQNVYEPDYVMVLDSSLLDVVDVFEGLRKNGTVIINTTKPIEKKNVHCLDATSIALETLGLPIVNTVMLGAFAKVSGLVSIGSIKTAMSEQFAKKPDLLEKNMAAISKAYEGVK